MAVTLKRIDEILLMKICIALLVFYNFWWIRIFGENSIIHWGLFLLLFLLSLKSFGTRVFIDREKKENRFLLLFVVITSLTSLIIASDYSNAFKSIFDMLEYAIIFCIVVSVSSRTRSVQWALTIMVIVCAICAITALIQSITFNERLVLGNTGNSNDLGIKMVYASACALLSKYRKRKSLLITISLLLLFAYVILKTGSRKSLIMIIVVFCLWIVLCVPSLLKAEYKRSVLIVTPFVLGLIIAACFLFVPAFRDSRVYVRLLYLEEGVDDRLSLYKEAWGMFVDHPIFGVGINNFRNYSSTGLYSHSLFAETLSCTGIVGSILFLLFYLRYFTDFIRLFKQRNQVSKYVKGALLIFLIVVLFFSFSVILYYDFASMMFLGIICCVLCVINDHGGLPEWEEELSENSVLEDF